MKMPEKEGMNRSWNSASLTRCVPAKQRHSLTCCPSDDDVRGGKRHICVAREIQLTQPLLATVMSWNFLKAQAACSGFSSLSLVILFSALQHLSKQPWSRSRRNLILLLAPCASRRLASSFSCPMSIAIAAGIWQKTRTNSSERRRSMQNSWEQHWHWALLILMTCQRTTGSIALVSSPSFYFLEAFWGSYKRRSLPISKAF